MNQTNQTEELINGVLNTMGNELTNDQLFKLKVGLSVNVSKFDVKEKETAILPYGENDCEHILNMFCTAKKIENIKESSLKYYKGILLKTFDFCNKPIDQITTNDLRYYMYTYQKISTHGVSQVTIDNIRRVYCSFFSWCCKEDIIEKNPTLRLSRTKIDKKIKNIMSDEDLEILRENCHTVKEIALVEFLYATGVRVSELCRLNIQDVNLTTGECVVTGKGEKDRVIVVNGRARVRLKTYLMTRLDKEVALFVSDREPYQRLTRSGVENIIRKLGKRSEISGCFPHAFRSKFATDALMRGCPIEMLAQMMGHEKIDTTRIYAKISREDQKHGFTKYA